ncbi:DUF433 domain-containing protein [candidate division KSB1 bacterium]|nr:DUF433 domain-containing protein [candidate division KSB1 bacterium]NIR70431.1 DUF433 domain-containing protein [candidate division KSB1 bacterium]NIS23161.1 DUF433 domain-containing protein [candidate division KSB1 bacterium]NIT70020.1 DUF433 domain-containing protein [candidate division KSB1 bacterium]NIU23658.1 DUF433 domain-containing protein [candidate division KSB1 bacterium]
MKLIREIVGGEPYEYYPLGEYIVRAPGVCGGRPTFKYTRIEITFILNLLAAGESIDDLVTAYEGRITREAIWEAIHLVTSEYSNTLPELETA